MLVCCTLPVCNTDDDEDYEYVELYNRGTTDVPIAGWTLQGTGYDFAPGATVPAQGFRNVPPGG